MKKVLCLFGIVVLFVLAFLPPILRIVLPSIEEKEKEAVKGNLILSCSTDDFLINTSYENEKVKMIIIKKFFSQEGINNKNNISTLFESIKEKSDIIYNVLEDGEVVAIDFSVSEHKELGINNLTQKLEDQQLYYENQELSCIVK